MFTFYIKREIRKFHVIVEQRRQRNVQKSVIHVQSCCFANLNLLLFLPLSLTSPSSLFKVPNCLSITRPWRFLYISAAQIPLYYSSLSLMQVKLPRKLLYERDGDATLHPWARRQASFGSPRQGETLCELLAVSFLLKIELTDTIVQCHVYFNVCHCGEPNSTRHRHRKGFDKIGEKTP